MAVAATWRPGTATDPRAKPRRESRMRMGDGTGGSFSSREVWRPGQRRQQQEGHGQPEVVRGYHREGHRRREAGGTGGQVVPQCRRGDCREGPRRNQEAGMDDRGDEFRRREVGLNGRREHLGRLRRQELHLREQLGEVRHLRSGGHLLGGGHGQRHERGGGRGRTAPREELRRLEAGQRDRRGVLRWREAGHRNTRERQEVERGHGRLEDGQRGRRGGLRQREAGHGNTRERQEVDRGHGRLEERQQDDLREELPRPEARHGNAQERQEVREGSQQDDVREELRRAETERGGQRRSPRFERCPSCHWWIPQGGQGARIWPKKLSPARPHQFQELQPKMDAMSVQTCHIAVSGFL